MNVFRRAAARLAAAFPPKTISDRLLPYATLVLAVIGATSALIQYANGLAIARVTATMDLHKQFLSETFRHALEDFGHFNERVAVVAIKTRCDFIKEAVGRDTVKVPPGTSLDCVKLDSATLSALETVNLQGEPRTQLRARVLAKVGELSASSDSLAQLDIFYRSVIICVERNNCSGDTAAALFAREMVTFVNATCAFDPSKATGETTNDKIARFLVRWEVNKNIYWNRDAGREKLFACDRQRAFEQ